MVCSCHLLVLPTEVKHQEAPEKSTKIGEPSVAACTCSPLLHERQFLPLWEVITDYGLCISPHFLSAPLSPSEPRSLFPKGRAAGGILGQRLSFWVLAPCSGSVVCNWGSCGLLQYICLSIGLLFLSKESLALMLSCCFSSLCSRLGSLQEEL